jgi:hypothetical protein
MNTTTEPNDERDLRLEKQRTELRASIADELACAETPLAHVLCAARLATLGDDAPYRAWPGALAGTTADLPDRIKGACLDLVVRLRASTGDQLVRALLDAQAFNSLLVVDREMGSLLGPAHGVIESMLLECDGRTLDDDAAAELDGLLELVLTPDTCLIPILIAPVGLTACMVLAEDTKSAGLSPVNRIGPVDQHAAEPELEAELVFDGGRPSERMIDRFARRRGVMQFDDGTQTEVRAVLEEDWRVTVQFSGDDTWCRRIDLVRLGARMARPLDDLKDFWTTSLANLGIDAQTRLVNQPIMIRLSNGQRFSI